MLAESITFFGVPSVDYEASRSNWLRENDGAYLRVSVRIDSPFCISPGEHGLFTKEDIELVMTVVGQGFEGVTRGRKEIPLAAFNFAGDKGFCQSATLPPTILIPAARFGAGDHDNITSPYLQVNMRATTRGGESLTNNIKTFLNVAGVFASGGAAATVTGMAGLFSDKNRSILGETYKQYTSNDPRGARVVLNQGWGSLVEKPVKTVVLPVYSGPLKSIGWGKLETPQTAAQRMEEVSYNGTDRTELMRVVFTVEYLRTLFVPQMANGVDFPTQDQVRTSRVLSYPNVESSGDFPNLLQRFSGSSPTIMKRLSQADFGSACRDALSTLDKQLYFNKVDRAVTMKSLLDEARGPNWHKEGGQAFWRECFQNYGEEIQGVSLAIYGLPNFTAGPENLEVSNEAQIKPWKDRAGRMLLNLHSALEKNGIKDRERAVGSLVGKAAIGITTDAGWQPSLPTDTAPHTGATSEEARANAISYLASRDIAAVGCFAPSEDSDIQNATTLRGAFAVVFPVQAPATRPEVWVANTFVFNVQSKELQGLALEKMNAGWARYFVRLDYDPQSTCVRSIKPILRANFGL
ncbi:MAG: hypothetical protein Q8K71_17465 [Polaromonas sp.]|nr:hypothetical protein [Polaromonas sp.]MDP3752127.1 hypothetical protein [Polaromonas sp.]